MKAPRLVARYAFCNGMSPQQREFALSRLCEESTRIQSESVDRSALPGDVPRTWILTTRDRTLSNASQQPSIAALGGVKDVIPIDACHDVMVTHPERLAQTLVERCRLRAG
jgi:pimeloyl-ACP methyl ester carboxylesterase